MKTKRIVGMEGVGEGEERGTVVVGVKLDSQSRQLLTWALVKVVKPGDRVVALHVLNNADTLSQKGNSSLLALVKAFESVLTVYEGFCNLKQVELKLKICRGSSVRKVLVQEAKSLTAAKVIVGISRNGHSIRSLSSIAKYCAKKLPSNCWVMATNNGKVVFEREAIGSISSSELGNKTANHQRPTKCLSVLHQTFSKSSKTLGRKDSNQCLLMTEERDGKSGDQESRRDFGACSTQIGSDCSRGVDSSHKPTVQKCPICESNSLSVKNAHSMQSIEEDDSSLRLIPVQTIEVASSSISLLIEEFPELRPGCPLLRPSSLVEGQTLERRMARKSSFFQWAMRLPAKQSVSAIHPDHKAMNQSEPGLDGETGAIVPVGDVVPPNSDSGALKKLPKELESLHEKYMSLCRLFSYQELLSATSNFSTDNMIGKGGSSQVYKGHLLDGKELAVKILNPSEDALKEFMLEIEIITTLHHKNIVSLFGFCFDENKLLLVYDFLPRGSLEENLHGKEVQTILSWDNRYKVAVGIAEALDYLHGGSTQPVIHRDVKSSNILLADDFEPQLSDFGFATWASASLSHITCTDVAGTFGYLAPEYFMYGKVNEKIDIYAFGVVLLELLSGRKPISNEYPKGQESLVMWAKPILQSGKVLQLLDPKLGDKYDNDQMEKIVMAASLCIRRSPRLRPRMSLILKLLQGDDETTKWARLQVNASEEFDVLDDEICPVPNIQSHLSLALLDVEDDSLSVSSIEPSISYLTANKSMEDYLQGRWSRSSSFD